MKILKSAPTTRFFLDTIQYQIPKSFANTNSSYSDSMPKMATLRYVPTDKHDIPRDPLNTTRFIQK